MPLIRCGECDREGVLPWEFIRSECGGCIRKPFKCPDCTDYENNLGYNELRRMVGHTGGGAGQNPTYNELIDTFEDNIFMSVEI